MSSEPYVINWPKYKTLEEWLQTQPANKWKEEYDRDGFLVVHNLLNEDCIKIYQDIYMKLLDGEIDTTSHRHDLGWYGPKQNKNQENICQIMWPSLFIPSLMEGPLHERVRAVQKVIVGPDAVFDFDMLISKVALDRSTVENGCMWFVPGSHKLPLREHHPAAKGAHILECECSEDEGVPKPLPPGSCTFHSGRTLHYSRGNITDNHRRAYITNYRPETMVQWEREHKFTHGKEGLNEIKRDDVVIVRTHGDGLGSEEQS